MGREARSVVRKGRVQAGLPRDYLREANLRTTTEYTGPYTTVYSTRITGDKTRILRILIILNALIKTYSLYIG